MTTVLLMNATGEPLPGGKRSSEFVSKRKEARRDIVNQTKAGIILVQDLDINIDSFLPKGDIHNTFGCLGSKQVGLLFRSDKFQMVGHAKLGREIASFCESLEKTNVLKTSNEVIPRLCAGQLEMPSQDFQCLCVSWFGPPYANIERRKFILKDMFMLIEKFMTGKPFYILIGGEFNLNFEDVATILAAYPDFRLVGSPQKENYQTKTSFFIISDSLASKVGYVHAFDTTNLLRYKYKVSVSDLKHVLKFDPLYLNIHH